jgi:hypothetical protein
MSVALRPSPTLLAGGALLAAALLAAELRAQDAAVSNGPGGALAVGMAAPVAGGVRDLPRLEGAVTLDGVPDEPAWRSVQGLPLTMYEPSFRGASDRRIEVLVAYDDDALYVAARFFHAKPDEIRAFSLTRDRWSGDDGFGILLDTFNDDENAMRFVGLPLGTRMDMSITGDGQGGDGGGPGQGGGPRGMSWNTFWDLKTRITDEGWFGEMRIPFSSLRFQTAADGSVVMGMMAYAYEPGKAHRWTFPAIPPSAPYTQVSAFQDVRLQGVTPRNPVYVTPYALTGRNRSAELAAAGDRYLTASGNDFELGGDVKINPTPNLTLDLTVNTDFAAVEADQQQVNLTRFSLFFDEKRPFFQERAGIFGFDTGAERGTLFYTRRIGLSGEGAPLRILGGARLVGRAGGWDLGFIEMQTASAPQTADEIATPTENFGVLRLRRRLLNANSFVGGMATSRIGGGGAYNVTYGLDTQLRVIGDEYLTLKWLQTLQGGDELRDDAPHGLDAGRVVLDWTRRRQQGFSYQNAFTWSGAGYEPGVGFELRRDFTRAQSDWNYQWYPGEGSSFRRIWLGLKSNLWVRNADRRVDTGQLEPFLTVETKPGTSLTLSTRTTYEDVLEAFILSDEAEVPVGSYRATEGAVEFRAPRGWPVRPNLTVTVGELYDGRRVGTEWSLNWAVNQHLELIGGWNWNRIRFDDRGQSFDTNLVRLQARAAWNTHLSLDTFIQYNSLTDRVSTNARLRYDFREGQDLWLVWNEGLILQRDVVGLPRLPLSEARTLTMKYTHTLVF